MRPNYNIFWDVSIQSYLQLPHLQPWLSWLLCQSSLQHQIHHDQESMETPLHLQLVPARQKSELKRVIIIIALNILKDNGMHPKTSYEIVSVEEQCRLWLNMPIFDGMTVLVSKYSYRLLTFWLREFVQFLTFYYFQITGCLKTNFTLWYLMFRDWITGIYGCFG